jgi:hypothetical protein
MIQETGVERECDRWKGEDDRWKREHVVHACMHVHMYSWMTLTREGRGKTNRRKRLKKEKEKERRFCYPQEDESSRGGADLRAHSHRIRAVPAGEGLVHTEKGLKLKGSFTPKKRKSSSASRERKVAGFFLLYILCSP